MQQFVDIFIVIVDGKWLGNVVEDIIVYGAGGLAKEIVQLIEDINSVRPSWNIKGYIDDIKGDCGEFISGYRILGAAEILRDMSAPASVILGIGDPAAKEMIYGKIKGYGLKFPVLIHPSAIVAGSAKIGEGSIIGIHCIVSVNVSIGRHVLLNTKTFVAHDTIIHDYSSCYVNCIINGNVVINESALIGSHSVIMERKTIGRRAKVSMGSIVTFDIEDQHVVMTRPSKSMYFGD